MILKIRTIYFKTANLAALRAFYAGLFGIQPKATKDSEEWVEFDFGNINLSLLPTGEPVTHGSNCVPVFEFPTAQIDALKQRVVALGGRILEDIYDETNSAVCQDIDGNEFEITDFHD